MALPPHRLTEVRVAKLLGHNRHFKKVLGSLHTLIGVIPQIVENRTVEPQSFADFISEREVSDVVNFLRQIHAASD
jgi:hypothetical protein